MQKCISETDNETNFWRDVGLFRNIQMFDHLGSILRKDRRHFLIIKTIAVMVVWCEIVVLLKQFCKLWEIFVEIFVTGPWTREFHPRTTYNQLCTLLIVLLSIYTFVDTTLNHSLTPLNSNTYRRETKPLLFTNNKFKHGVSNSSADLIGWLNQSCFMGVCQTWKSQQNYI